MEKITKTESVKQFVLNEQWDKAFSIASKFRRLGKYKNAITKAASARQNPRFYQQIGDLNAIDASGKAGLIMMFITNEGNPNK